jgi:hypothetical protein
LYDLDGRFYTIAPHVFERYKNRRHKLDPISGVSCCTYPDSHHVPHVFKGGNFDGMIIVAAYVEHHLETHRGQIADEKKISKFRTIAMQVVNEIPRKATFGLMTEADTR